MSVKGRPTYNVNRNPDGSVGSIGSTERTVTVNRNPETGAVLGVTVTEL